MLIGTARPAYSVQQLIHSVSTLWEMQLPPEFVCSQFINNCDDDWIFLSLVTVLVKHGGWTNGSQRARANDIHRSAGGRMY